MAGIFKAYDIRGAFPGELDEDTAFRIGAAFAALLDRPNVVLGRDMRPSSPALAAAFIKGAVQAGAKVTDIGMTTTPMLYYAIIDGEYDGGAMVTASHLPSEMNGFKLCRESAIPLSGDSGIPALEQSVRRMSAGASTSMPGGNCRQGDFLGSYIDRLSDFIEDPAHLKVVVDAGNGMAGREVAELFRRSAKWTLVGMYMEPDGRFPHHVANPLIESTTADLQGRVVKENADIGVAFDGDADRCGFIDEKGQRIPEDLITALIAESYLHRQPGAKIVYDLRSSRVVPETIRQLNGTPVRSRVGHAFIKKLMREEDAVFGGELSGHYYYRDMGFTDNAVFTMIWMLNFLALKKAALSGLVEPLRKYRSTGEINMQIDDPEPVFAALEETYSGASLDHLDGLTVEYDSWWFNLRASNTEPLIRLNMEAESESMLEEKKKEVLDAIHNAVPSMQLV